MCVFEINIILQQSKYIKYFLTQLLYLLLMNRFFFTILLVYQCMRLLSFLGNFLVLLLLPNFSRYIKFYRLLCIAFYGDCFVEKTTFFGSYFNVYMQ